MFICVFIMENRRFSLENYDSPDLSFLFTMVGDPGEVPRVESVSAVSPLPSGLPTPLSTPRSCRTLSSVSLTFIIGIFFLKNNGKLTGPKVQFPSWQQGDTVRPVMKAVHPSATNSPYYFSTTTVRDFRSHIGALRMASQIWIYIPPVRAGIGIPHPVSLLGSRHMDQILP